jgi:NAD(P)-dependent dehydrogenase (short-subunit alcohol dehydrogenase family)
VISGLDGRVVIVTGAAGGLGRAFVGGFAEAGARVVAADVQPADLEGAALSAEVDVANAESVAAMVDRVVDELGAVDVLVNNAGIYADLARQPFWALEPDDWDQVMAVNLRGPWLCARACVPHMQARGGGAIVNISSASVLARATLFAHYVASKAGLIGLTRAMAMEAGDLGVRVNAIAPGFTVTEASRRSREDAEEFGVAEGAIKRAEYPEDLVGTALFLASPASAFVTGQTIVVDGGRHFL